MKVLLAMSGGVDSSVAGALLLEDGHEVVGVTMKLWGGESDTGCCSVSDVEDARRVAQQLGIDHLVFNFAEDFDRHVVDVYVADHARGVTPNPCIECNRHLKFDRLLHRADQLGFDAVATGHHARIVAACGPGATEAALVRGADRAKDQSYVVHMLDQASLRRIVFPVGSIDKAEVRRIAAELGLRTATKPDSQDVCFISSVGGRTTFLGDRIPLRSGRVVDTSGNDLGSVASLELVTIGQRRGVGIPGGGPKRYVVDVDHAARLVTVGESAELERDELAVGRVGWTGPAARTEATTGRVLVQCSAHATPVPARLRVDTDGASAVVRWERPERRVAPGQSVVFYDASDTRVLGGGIALN